MTSVIRRRTALAVGACAFLLAGCDADSATVGSTGAAAAGTVTASPSPSTSVSPSPAPSPTPSPSPAPAPTSSPSPSPNPADDPSPPFASSSVQDPDPATGAGSAQELLETLAVKGRAPLTGYEREEYGQAWADVDRNGCDTRNDILRRDLRDEVFKPGTRDCVVVSGVLDPDPYTGRRIEFVRGETTSTAIQIDHVVALADSWVTGAFTWDERKRIAFANDPLNLLAVDGPSNSQKGAGDAATWLPRSAYRCDYVARQIAVKAKYGLWVKAAEKDAMNRILDTCPGKPVPSYGPVELPSPGLGSAHHEPAPTPAASGGLDPRFPYCTDAKAAGYGPYTRGEDPEYDWYRDADSDGVVCE